MKKIFFALFCLVSMASFAQITPAAKGVNYGAKIASADGAIDVSELNAKLVNAKSFVGKVKGTVVEVCQEKGCWMKLKQANGDGLMIRFKDYKFFMPKDIVGKEVVLDGLAKRTTVSVEMQQHYAEDAGKSQKEIDAIKEAKEQVEFTANGVLVI